MSIFPSSPENLEFEGDLMFLGYGIDAPEYSYNDYENRDVKGKILVLLDNEPESSDEKFFAGSMPTVYSSLKYKVKIAYERGANGVIFITTPNSPEKLVDPQVGGFPGIFPGYKTVEQKPIIILKKEARDWLLKMKKMKIKEIRDKINKDLKPFSFDLGLKAKVDLKIKILRKFADNNILGVILPGAKDKIDEYVMMGAHYDCQGVLPDGTLYPGADDNASGVAGVLAAAKYINSRKENLRRPVIIAFWTAEERGLLGSEYYSTSDIFPKDKTITYINADMLGRNHLDLEKNSNFLMVFHSAQSLDLSKILKNNAEKADLKCRVIASAKMGRGDGDSDHIHFHRLNIPSIFFFSGIHEDYEKPGDAPDKLNYEKIQKEAFMIALTAMDIANEEKRPLFDPNIKPEKGMGKRPF
jgi:hypothetical protein